MTATSASRVNATRQSVNSGKPDHLRVVRGARGWAPEPGDTAPLPASVVSALKAIVADMRNIPREVITDRGELIHFLNRMAGRVDGVAKLRVAFTPPASRRPPTVGFSDSDKDATQASTARVLRNEDTRPLSGHALAAAVFASPSTVNSDNGLSPDSGIAASAPRTRRRDEVRTVTSRKGRPVPVQIRRARAAGQMELGV